MTDPLHGVRLGIDPGDARIGVASCDPSRILASPVETVPRVPPADPPAPAADLDRIAAIAAELDAVLVYVGLPRSLSGGEGPAAGRVREFAQALARRVAPLPVRLVDERLSTVTAESVLRERGKKGKKRRAVVDQAAAVVILQAALDSEHARGAVAGEPVDVPQDTAEE
ncbi:Holliday junction resolvase RuvX [Marmoricola sp. RAF53]|uniref:Holliday junction resolvase RuvX n=1 Tax=Marmoricola sp. RAF53 TaxID=3233059 RepID=UPI003F9C4928